MFSARKNLITVLNESGKGHTHRCAVHLKAKQLSMHRFQSCLFVFFLDQSVFYPNKFIVFFTKEFEVFFIRRRLCRQFVRIFAHQTALFDMVHIKWTLWILIYVVCKKFVFCRKLILKALFRFNGTSKPSLTIALKILKTIEKPLIPMVGPSKNIQW